jgi:hypothetical protein
VPRRPALRKGVGQVNPLLFAGRDIRQWQGQQKTKKLSLAIGVGFLKQRGQWPRAVEILIPSAAACLIAVPLPIRGFAAAPRRRVMIAPRRENKIGHVI